MTASELPIKAPAGTEPCPWCGDADMLMIASCLAAKRFPRRRVVCLGCRSDGPQGDDDAMAVELWNRRPAITAAVAAERDACRKIADEQVALIETLQASYEGMPPIQGLARECARTARSIRDAIEARGEEPTNG